MRWTVAAAIIIVVAVAASLAAYLYRPARQVTITVVTYNDVAPVVEMAAEEFEAQHPGVKVRVVSYPWDTYVEQEITVLKAGSLEYDVVTFTPTSSQLIAPYLVPLNTSYFNWSDIIADQEDFGGLYYNASSGRAEVIGIAFQTWVELLAYNATLFNNATLQHEFQEEYGFSLNPWTWGNWSQVVDADKFFVSHNITKYGFLVEDEPKHELIDTFPAIFEWYYMHNQSLNCGNPAGLPGYGTMFMGCVPSWWGHGFPPPAFNSTAGVEALETLRELVSYEPPPSQLAIGYSALVSILSQGSSAGAIAWANDIMGMNSSVASQLLMAPLPGGYGEPGSTFLGISRYSQHKQLALEFLQFIVSPQFQVRAFYAQGSLPISREAYLQVMNNASLPAYEREWLRAILVANENATATPPTLPQTYPVLIPSFNGPVFEWLSSPTSSPMQVLQQAARAWVEALGGGG
ncbi:extracellular solute-binding protein [Acidilobus saccharovorans]|uniref:extracellular solute-binding protein n=1 Tax=Acidilobus saccharovorans TaxID=242703 RepID=UPI0006620340|nr:extracellular solute-binding protein [Acidilobus saccharovorans]